MTDEHEPLFSDRRVRRAGFRALLATAALPLVSFAAGVFTYWLLAGHGAPIVALLGACAAGLGCFLVGQDYLFLGRFNRRLRDELVEKLRRLGELGFRVDDPDVYFIGLAHPSKVSWSRWETDDDVGFLRLTFDGFEYHGDKLSFTVSWEDVASIDLEPMGYGFPRVIKRIRVRFVDGEPLEEALLCGREGDRLSSGNRVTYTLYEAVRNRWERRRTGRLTGLEATSPERVRVDDS